MSNEAVIISDHCDFCGEYDEVQLLESEGASTKICKYCLYYNLLKTGCLDKEDNNDN